MYSWTAMGPHGQAWTTGLVGQVGMGQPLTASQGWTTGQVRLGQIEPGVPAAIKREAEAYISRLFGKAYELIPDAIKREIERRYIESRLGELGISERLAVVKKALPVVPILIGVAFLLLRR